jgi:hypothetical protein
MINAENFVATTIALVCAVLPALLFMLLASL